MHGAGCGLQRIPWTTSAWEDDEGTEEVLNANRGHILGTHNGGGGITWEFNFQQMIYWGVMRKFFGKLIIL